MTALGMGEVSFTRLEIDISSKAMPIVRVTVVPPLRPGLVHLAEEFHEFQLVPYVGGALIGTPGAPTPAEVQGVANA